MTSGGGQFYREKFKPPTIQYMEQHFAKFYEFMENMPDEYVTYVKNMSENYSDFVQNLSQEFLDYTQRMSSRAASYLEQTVPVQMNRERTLTTLVGDATFITPAVAAAVGLIDADFTNLVKAFLLIIGRAVNTFAGQNNLDCTTATHNQWMMSVGAGAYADLQNGAKADGQMLDTDWECMALGVIHPFTLMFDITDRLTALNDTLGVRLAQARSRQDSMIVTIDVYMKVVWKL